MITHLSLGDTAFERSRLLHTLIKNSAINYAGNRSLKIYGTLQCKPGRRMKAVNRVFFASEAEAIAAGYRPCGHCMKKEYLIWKKQ